MNKVEITFTKFMNTILKVVLPLFIIASIGIFIVTMMSFNIGTIVFSFAVIISGFVSYKIINLNCSNKQKIFLLILLSIMIRSLWLLNTNNTPVSDFDVMYKCGENLLQGNTENFKGTGYIARFPHLTMTVLYMSLIQYLSPENNLLVMKIINLSLGISSLLFIYFIVDLLFEDKRKSLISLSLGGIFPPLITYTSVYCSENIAIPFYLVSIYLFLKAIKSKNHKGIMFILCGLVLGIGNLFRMVADVVLIAYVLYIIIYFKEKIFRKMMDILFIALPYLLVIVLFSTTLQKMNITENSLWKGSEPKITNVLKGTNISSLGMWNAEDAGMVEDNINDYDKLDSKCKEIIYNRLTTTSKVKLSIFYVAKLCAQWCIGDFAGSFWTQKDTSSLFSIGIVGSAPFQLFYIGILILVFLGIKNKRYIDSNNELNLINLIFIGYMAAYLITEYQSRYGYIVCWTFIILAIDGLEYVDVSLLVNCIRKLFIKFNLKSSSYLEFIENKDLESENNQNSNSFNNRR